MAAPTRVATYTSPPTGGNGRDTVDTRSISNVSVQVGDRVVVFALSENDSNSEWASGGTDSCTMTGLTFTRHSPNDFGGGASVAVLWYGTATSTGSYTVTVDRDRTGSTMWSLRVIVYRNSDGFGNVASVEQSGSTAQLAITTTQANSALPFSIVDWNAVNGSSRAYVSVNGSTATEEMYAFNAAASTQYAARYDDAGAIGAKTVGLSAPTGQNAAIIAIEIKGTTGSSAQNVSGAGAIASAGAIGSPTVTPGAVSVAPSGIASAGSIGSPTISASNAVAPTGIASAGAFGSATISTGAVSVSPSGIGSAEAFGTAVVNSGGSIVSPAGIASDEAFGTVAVTPGPVTVATSGIASAEGIGSPTLTPGPVTVSPTGIASGEAIGNAVISGSGVTNVSPQGIDSSEAFGSATLTAGPVTVAPSGIASGQALGAPTLSAVISLLPDGIASGEAFGTPVLATGPTTVSPSGIPSAGAFGSAVVYQTGKASDGNGFFAFFVGA